MPVKRYILTGGPATGKTSCIQYLSRLNYPIFKEVARIVIEDSLKKQSDCVPWLNLNSFSTKVFDLQLQDYHNANEGISFYDRSPVDVLAYMQMGNLEISTEIIETCKTLNYQKQVFLFPFWDQLFQNDAVRKESADKAREIEYWLTQKYSQLGYEIIKVPLDSITNRANFIVNYIGRFN